MPSLTRATIESIAAGGDGVARADGLAVFVPRTAPGDVADLRIRLRGRFGRGEVVRVLENGPARVSPRCRHYGADRCGGCQLQHLDYPAQLAAKQRIVRDAFVRIARQDLELPPIVPSPSPWEYRAKLTLAMRRVGETWTFGLHAYDAPGRVFQLRECPITEPRLVEVWREVQAASMHLPPERQLRGGVRRVGDEMAFLVEGGRRWDRAREFARRCPSLHLIRWKSNDGTVRVIVDRRLGDAPAAAFEQVNPDVADTLREALLARALAVHPRSAIDAYAGRGATALALAAAGVRVTAIEVDAEASSFAATHAPEIMTVRQARVEDVVRQVLPADVVVLNPPRAGIDARVAEALQDGPRPRLVLYVSCDPATLARDVSRLPSYHVGLVESYDMFPQTAHVETLCALVPLDR